MREIPAPPANLRAIIRRGANLRGSIRRAAVLGAAVLVLLPTASPTAGAKDVDLVPVAPGVHAALQAADDRFNDSNSVVIEGANGVLVVDAQASTAYVESLIARIRTLTDKPARTLVYTHWHLDHTQNAGLYTDTFGDSIEVIGHVTLAEDIRARAIPQLRAEADELEGAIAAGKVRLGRGVARDGSLLDAAGKAKLAAQIEAANITLAEKRAPHFVAPTRTVTEQLELHDGERTIRLLHVRAHTRGDLVVFLPAEKFLVTGDVLDDLPFGGHGYPREWIAALSSLERLDFDTIVPGHGQIRHGKEHLRRVRGFFTAIVEQVDAAVREKKSLADTQAAIDWTSWRTVLAGDDARAQRNFDEFAPAAVERAWLEARAELPD